MTPHDDDSWLEGIESRWRKIIVDNPWPKTDYEELQRLMGSVMSFADIRGLADDASQTYLLDLHFRLRTYWDVKRLEEEAKRFDARMCRLTPAQRKRQVHLWIRCPSGSRPCTLLEVYKQPLPDGGGKVFAYVSTRRETKVVAVTRAVADGALDPVIFLPIGCRHGSGRIDRDAVRDLGWSELPAGSTRTITGTFPFPTGEFPVLGQHAPYNYWNARDLR